MIPWTLIILGALCTIVGVLGLAALLLLPIFERFEIVFDKDKDIVQARTDAKVGKIVWEEKRHLTRDFIICIFVGILMFFAGMYLGYAAKGDSFWPYRKMFPSMAANSMIPESDKINENGQFISAEGRTYNYYIYVDGNNISFKGEPCADLEDLKHKLAEIRRDNTVAIYDDFAVSSTYRAVKKMLDELGIAYEEAK